MANLYFDGQHYDCRYQDYDRDIDFWNNLEICKEASILELCSGTGRLTSILSRKANKVTAIDNSISMIEQAKAKLLDHKNIVWINSDIETMNLNDNFDYVIMGGLSLGGFNNDDFSKVLKNLSRHMKVGGKFIFDGLTANCKVETIKKPRYRYSYNHPTDGEVNVYYKNEVMDHTEKIQLFYVFNNQLSFDERNVQYYSMESLVKQIILNNFQVEFIYSDYDGTSFTSNSKQFVMSIIKGGD
ncbi:hypothetical protein DOK67_0000680 [Enterococcus sp. DIV0212c]|uniref:class I SAM-dependent methyltransferase n=1 Tax=Enterococcus sp. DIV0212c TaxID=2230867 RepID=UPI001A9BADF6|nr:class I SAM-dependent methyltransferase [Enterococcus sp. DIV0212c]MBO1354669.1 class I SAM-dependent methyltransferase [Enterococcus sp. DIV0212c]